MTQIKSAYFKSFFTTEKSLRERFQKTARANGFSADSQSSAIRWQKRARKIFGRILAQDRFEKVPLKAKKLSTVKVGDLFREEWLVLTEKEVWMPVSILFPGQVKGKIPTVLCFHGHGMAGRYAPSGRHDIPAMKEVFDRYHADYGYQLAKMGFIAVCPDARGFGQRREGIAQDDQHHPGRFYESTCRPIQLASVPLGIHLQGMMAWDAVRLVDWLCENKRVDADRLGAVGLSGGGMQTLNLGALDERIKACVVSGYFYGVRESLQEMNQNCMCNMVPHLWENFDMGDLGALCAPRGLFIETGSADPLNGKSGVKNVTKQFRIAKKAYSLLGREKNIGHHVFDGGHYWSGKKSLPWLKERLQ